MRQLLITLITGSALLLLPNLAWAQQGTITGTITDQETGASLPGATVQILEEGMGAATNAEGSFRITGVPTGEYTVEASFVGYNARQRTVTVSEGETATVNFQLQPQTQELGEVVVTGQGSAIQTKRLPTSSTTVSAEEVASVSTGRIDQALQSQLKSTQIRLNSGQPGTTSLIKNRGPVSATGVTTPVIYVDGVRVDNQSTGSNEFISTGGARSSSIADIPLENIERVEFLSGGAATTIYGSDAANGVLQIFTKDGAGTPDQLNFETRIGAEYGTKDFLKYDRTGDLIFQDPAFVHSYKLSGNGSTEGGYHYSFSGKMFENNTTRLGADDNIRYDVNATLGANPLENVDVTMSANYVHNNYGRALNANTSFSQFGNLEGAQLFQNEQGNPVVIDSLSRDLYAGVKDSLRNSVRLYNNRTNIDRLVGSSQLRYNPIESISMKFTAGLDFRQAQNKEIVTNQFLRSVGSGSSSSSLADFNRTFLGLTLSANVSHTYEWRFLSLQSNLGGDVFRDESRIARLDADGVPDGSQTVESGSQSTASDDLSTVAQRGAYLKENIGFGDRFFIDLGLRVDENSAFGDDTEPQWYPAVGFAYTVTDEPFLEDVLPSNIISNLKLRGSYGETGNFPEPFSRDRLLSVNAFLGQTSYTFDTPGEPTLGPERVKTYEAGADLSLFDGRANFQITRYDETTEDALFEAPFAPSTAQADQVRNIGEVSNKGWEFAGQFSILQTPDYSLSVNASLNTNTNEVVDNGQASKFNNGGFLFLGTFVDEGQPIGYLEGDKPFFNPETGQLDSVQTDAVLGNPNPDKFGSLGLTARYQGLTLRATADYQTGAQGVNTNEVLRFFKAFQGINALDEGRFPNPNNEQFPPAVVQALSDPSISFTTLAGVFVEDTDYLKVRNIALDYQIPDGILPSTVRSVRLGASVRNPFNFTTSNFDPEVNGSENAQGTVAGAFGFGTISPPRQYTFTLNVGF